MTGKAKDTVAGMLPDYLLKMLPESLPELVPVAAAGFKLFPVMQLYIIFPVKMRDERSDRSNVYNNRTVDAYKMKR